MNVGRAKPMSTTTMAGTQAMNIVCRLSSFWYSVLLTTNLESLSPSKSG